MAAQPDTESRYANASQLILVAVVEYLGASANLMQPRALKDISEGVNATKDQVFRTLQTLESVGWAERLGTGYVISPDLTRFADRVRLRLADLTRRHLETEQCN